MKKNSKIIAVLIFLWNGTAVYGQSDGCSTATPISVTTNCFSPTPGTTIGASQTIPGCVGTADDDVWYSFVATAASHQIDVVGAAGFDAVVQLFSNTCSTLTSLNCQDGTGSGGTETIYANNLTIGVTYRIRVYHYFGGAGSGNFTICVKVGPPPPSNDFCSSAIPLTVNTTCLITSATSLGATQTMVGCAGTADDDVWFSFVATNSVQTITVNPASTMDAVVQLVSGACINFTSLYCEDVGFTNGTEIINAVGLTPGTTYYVRVYDYYNGNGGDAFDICVTGTPTPIPTNDEPCTAIQLPPITAACNYLNFTTIGATASLSAPTPSACVGGSGTAIGGFSASSSDVWFAITVPASGSIFINPQPDYGINDGVMALYTGTCGALSQYHCSDDHNYPGNANDLKPYIAEVGLTPGTTMYIRYWGFGTSTGDFGLCVSSPTNDDCANALYICDINGYSASTSAAYTPDLPGTGTGQMYGNGETTTGVFLGNLNTVHSGGPFGSAPGSSTFYNVTIDNNSWIMFTASAATATLTVSIYGCWVGNFPSGGIQMQVFSGTNCNNFVPVSNFEENSTGFVITATGLTVGQNYYLMVDGFAGDICNYTITADSGVQFPEITASNNPICANGSTVLTGPPGATSYLWFPGGQTTQTITVSPSATTTYSLIVEGVCEYKQTLTKTITVNQLPAMTSTTTPTAICSGQSVGLNLISNLPSTYTWVAAPNASVGGESTLAQTGALIGDILTNLTSSPQTVTYTVTPTSTVGTCVGNPQIVTVTVNPNPPVLVLASNTPICVGSPINLTANTVAGTYTWIGPNGFTSSLEDPTITSAVLASGGTYSATVTVAGCTSPSASTSVVVNTIPPALTIGSNSPVCEGGTINLTANTVAGTYSWTGPNGFSSALEDPTVTSSVLASAGTYSATVTVLGCTSTVSTTAVVINAIPSILTLGSNTSVCEGSAINLTANIVSGGTYSWTGPNGFSSALGSPTIPSSVLANGGAYSATVTVLGCTSLSASTTVMINAMDDPSFNYATSTYCVTGTNPSATITGLSGGVFSINNGGVINGIDGVINLNLSGIGIYIVTYTTNGVCPNSTSASINVTTAPDATFSYAQSSYCQVGTTPPVYPFGSSGGAFSATPVGLSINNLTGDIDLVNSLAGTYTVTNDIVASGGCAQAIATATVIITPPDNDGFIYSSPSFCSSEPNPIPTINVSGGMFTGSLGLIIDAVTGQIDISNTPFGTYSVTYTTTGTCVNDSAISITISGQLNATITVLGNSLCETDAPTTLTAANTGGTWTGTGVNATTGVFDPQVSGAGTFSIVYQIMGSCGDVDSISVVVNLTPNVTVIGDTICDGSSPFLMATGSGGVINWYSDSDLTTLVASDTNIYSPVLTEGIYTFYVQETLNGCTGLIDSANANFFDLNASFTATPEIGNVPLIVNLLNTSSVIDTLNDLFNWNFGNGEISSSYESSITYNNPGTFSIVLTVTNQENMCSDTASVTIIVDGDHTISIPNVFTPNGDGQNDTFYITSTNIITLKAGIYNRWGLLIFNWNGVEGGWNGRTKAGVEASEGVYYYIIDYTDYKGDLFSIQGYFNLNR